MPSQLNSLPKIEVLSLQSESGRSPTGSGGMGENLGGGLTGKLMKFDGRPKLRVLYLGANSLTGTIPSTFLSGVVDKSQAMEVDLTLNMLSGEIPSDLADFDNMNFHVAGNEIDVIPEEIRNKGSWMGGEVENGWDAILFLASVEKKTK